MRQSMAVTGMVIITGIMARNIKSIIGSVYDDMRENFFTDRPLNQNAPPTVWSTIVDRPEKGCPMMRAPL